MKKLLYIICVCSLGLLMECKAQTTEVNRDSAENKTINVYNPASVSEQSVIIADTNAVTVPVAGSTATIIEKRTEKVRIYSGSHEGNNVIGAMEIIIPEKR